MSATRHDAFVPPLRLPLEDEPLPATVRLLERLEPGLGALVTLVIVLAGAAAALI